MGFISAGSCALETYFPERGSNKKNSVPAGGELVSSRPKMTRKTASIESLCLTLFLLAGCASPQGSQTPRQPRLAGTLRGPTYYSAHRDFSVPVPVSPEVGGHISADGPETVTFVDNWGSRITFSLLPFNGVSSMMSVLQTQGHQAALTEFARRDYGGDITIHYHPAILDGAITFIFLRPVGPKTGIAAFIHGRDICLVQTDLLPGVQLLGQSDEKSQIEREQWLENRALALAQTIEFR